MGRVAGAVMTFCRPDYLDKALTSLERCVGADKIDWFFFQDGLKGHPEYKVTYDNVTQEHLDACINRVKSTTLPIKNHEINKLNQGVNHQINKVFKLFNNYNKLFIFEDDLVVSKYYLKLLNAISREQPNIMSTFYSIGEKAKNNRDFRVMIKAQKPRSWGFCLTREAWDKIEPRWNKKYKERFDNGGYRTPYYDTVITQFARTYAGGKFMPKISRAFYVGQDGILSYNKGNWKKRGLHKQLKEIEYDTDKNVRDFIIRR
jgi:hypothetical protein